MKKTGKEKQPIKCAKCNLEFSESELSDEHVHKAFVFQGKVMCETCLFKMGTNPQEAQAWGAFIASQNQK